MSDDLTSHKMATDCSRHYEEGGSSVEDSCTCSKSGVRTVNSDCIQICFPKPLCVDIVHGHKCGLVKFGGIKTTESDFAIILLICQARNLVRDDSSGYRTLRRQGLDGSELSLKGSSRLRQAHQPIKLHRVTKISCQWV